ncbi:Arylsulfatase [Pigmentiphaga humi]|uniref:Arylsulfatase n=1 Tax=Pigmentiphaga humi TaxID=2478468 RepID=A0A3P4B0P8_9BURK|nr:sulfatase-like hydrolase/transferase [Pigmentiphaga humi]VCU69869.1 Arylsulfatase [Pigmentiphaga humi]
MRPNFLMFIVDQLCADHLGCYGNATVRTPHIDGLANRGWLATNAYVTTPICMPNRASLMTGRMPSAHGVRHNGLPLGMDAVTFPELLRAEGYATSLIGKSHLQTMTDHLPLPHPLRPRQARDGARRYPGDYSQECVANWRAENYRMSLPYYGFEQAEIAIEHGDDINGHYRQWLRGVCPEGEALLGRQHALPSGYELAKAGQAWRTRIPEAFHPSAWIADRTSERLREYAQQELPFFVYASFPDPHHPYTPPGKYWDMYKPDDMPLPASYHSANPPPHLAWLRNEREQGRAHKTSMACFAATEREVREAIALNYGAMSFIDMNIGRVLRTLEDCGLAENTVVIFTSDHGEYAGDHQLLFKGSLHYRSLVRTPLVWAAPAGRQRQETAMVSTIDLAPTILETAGVAPCNGMQGRSFAASVAGRAYDGHEAVLIEEEGQRTYFGFQAPVRMKSLIDARYRLSLYEGVDWGELYDRRDDPLECRNRWNDAAFASIRQAMIEKLLRVSMAHADTALSPLAVA